jgi:hypothetical protein
LPDGRPAASIDLVTTGDEDILEMTDDERRRAIDEIMAKGHSREAAERALRFATGEESSDLIIPE